MRLYSVRGAVCCDNTASSIQQNVGTLCERILSLNGISCADIVSVQFTVTGDLDALNPAAAFRHAGIPGDTAHVPLFCAAEPPVQGMLPRVIRVMVTYYAGQPPREPVYLNGAEVLRPDLARKDGR